jgi:hypothetical protein
MCGWERTRAALSDLWIDAKAVWAAHEADDARDADGDGVPDTDQLEASQLLTRKLSVAARAIRDPDRLAVAIGGLYTSWLAVQGVLRLEFARTITLGVSIAEMATPTLQRIGVPVLAHLVPAEYRHWIPLMIRTAARAIGVAVAWRVQAISSKASACACVSVRAHRASSPRMRQAVVSAVHLALRGGLLFSRSSLTWLTRRGLLRLRHEDTCVDEVGWPRVEHAPPLSVLRLPPWSCLNVPALDPRCAQVVGYSAAVLGFYCQLEWGFAPPFPLNIFLLPMSWVEWCVRESREIIS